MPTALIVAFVVTFAANTVQKAPEPPIPKKLQALIEDATKDLAKRLSVDEAEITVEKAEAVTWPDGSLGCPQPGMAYTQMLTPGYLIVLKVKDLQYEYHSSRAATRAEYCKNPKPPVPGTPGDR